MSLGLVKTSQQFRFLLLNLFRFVCSIFLLNSIRVFVYVMETYSQLVGLMVY